MLQGHWEVWVADRTYIIPDVGKESDWFVIALEKLLSYEFSQGQRIDVHYQRYVQ